MPYLCGFKGTALFLDADMVVTGDIAELFAQADGLSAVQVNKDQAKFEWPSAMLFDCELASALTPEFVEDKENVLYDFAWANRVGSFSGDFNHCVGYAQPRTDAKLYHFTKGIPIWRETRGNPEDAVFHDAYKHMLHSVSHAELMGNSVHVQKAS